MNTQPIEKKARPHQDGEVAVHSVFYTIQGEGPFCGTPAVFIRLAGCNLQCPECDTDYTSSRWQASPQALLELVRLHIKKGLVVITGGEPFRQGIGKLVTTLFRAGYYIQIETNGSLPPEPELPYNVITDARTGVYVVCSPKAGKVRNDVWHVACAVKYVTDTNLHVDGLPLRALGHSAAPFVARPPTDWTRPIYLQPMDSAGDPEANQRHLKAAIQSCMTNGYVLQLQVHKLLGME